MHTLLSEKEINNILISNFSSQNQSKIESLFIYNYNNVTPSKILSSIGQGIAIIRTTFFYGKTQQNNLEDNDYIIYLNEWIKNIPFKELNKINDEISINENDLLVEIWARESTVNLLML